jgi:hypothetical protein
MPADPSKAPSSPISGEGAPKELRGEALRLPASEAERAARLDRAVAVVVDSP